jgi:hypothetical protein
VKRLVVSSLLCAGCSLAFPMSEYDEGTGSGANGGAAGSGGVAATAGGGPGGQGATGGGTGGELDCGPFAYPPISGIQNDFGSEIGPDLGFLNCGVVQNGQVVLDPTRASEFCWFYNVTPHRLTCDAVTFRLIEAGSQEIGMQRFIYLDVFDGPAGETEAILQEVNGFSFTTLQEVESSFHSVDDAWWRLRADQDTLYFETSPDGATWKLKGSGPAPFSLDSVRVRIGAGVWQAIATPLPVSYDCLNVPPPCP